MSEVELGMSAYEQSRWNDIQDHWEKKAKRLEMLRANARDALMTALASTNTVAAMTGSKLAEIAPEPVNEVVGGAGD